MPPPIELRSDTFTKPTAAMLEAMRAAEVGDDVFGEDPTVNALEQKAASMFGKEAGLFCPSGTMTNQIAIRMHTQPQDEVVCDKLAHVYNYEGGGIAYNSFCSVRLLEGHLGRLNADMIEANINPDDVHFPRTRLVCLENTVNKGGGSIYDSAEVEKIHQLCREKGLKLHLDGARLFNALVVTGERSENHGRLYDSVSICLSKGLGCPVGSLLLGSAEDIKRARKIRKVLGGGMRQAGFLAAAGIYALDLHITRLKEDHQRAAVLAKALKTLSGVIEVLPALTNIVIAEFESSDRQKKFIQSLAAANIRVAAFGPKAIRMVTHLDVDDHQVDQILDTLSRMKDYSFFTE
jgi:threonine aldolase